MFKCIFAGNVDYKIMTEQKEMQPGIWFLSETGNRNYTSKCERKWEKVLRMCMRPYVCFCVCQL